MNPRERKIIVEFTKTLKEATKVENDPWKFREEIADSIEEIARKVRDLSISENQFHYGDLQYKRDVTDVLKKLEGMSRKFSNEMKTAIGRGF